MNVTPTCSVLAAALMAGLMASACGDDSNSRPVFTSGVQAGADASVSSLPEDQREKICRSRESYFETNVNLDVVAQAVCLASAVIVGGTPEECQATLDRCIANRGDLGLGVSVNLDTPLLGTACADELANCNASVSALETCVNVNTGIVYNILDALSCRRAGDAAARNEAMELKGAQACASLGNRCAGFDEPVVLR